MYTNNDPYKEIWYEENDTDPRVHHIAHHIAHHIVRAKPLLGPLVVSFQLSIVYIRDEPRLVSLLNIGADTSGDFSKKLKLVIGF